ncbi:MAG TPA: hypothetical protein VGO67_07365, partial [Verrucomicrobiae bacterium]
MMGIFTDQLCQSSLRSATSSLLSIIDDDRWGISVTGKIDTICARLEQLKKFCGRLKRGFLSSGKALATEHIQSDLRWSRNAARTQKDRSFS